MDTAEIIDFEEADPREWIVRDILTGVSDIASPPQAYLELVRLLDDDTATAKDFATAIERDPGLCARLLRLVNSPYYGAGGTVDSIPRAITRVGLRDLEALVLSASAVEAFSGIAAAVVDMKMFWSHSVYCAIAARTLATRARCPNPGRLYAAGLLHDIGALAIYSQYPELAERSIIEAAGNEAKMVLSEHEWIGSDHALIGARMLANWQIPAVTCGAIQHHHSLVVPRDTLVDATLIHAADLLANQSADGRYSGLALAPEAHTDLNTILALTGLNIDCEDTELAQAIDLEFSASIEAFLG